MPIVFFRGLGVSCYVGGEGGRQYLLQAKHVMERMFGEFPIVAIWRPHDIYRGVGQCAALLSYRNLSGKQDFSEFDSVVRNLKERILDVRRQIDEIQTKKQQLMNEVKKDQDVAEELRSLISQQAEIRRCNDYTSLTRRLGLIENVQAVVELHPCIIDYAVSVGLKDTGAKWITFLEEDGDLSKDVSLSTCLDEAFADSSKATYHE